MSRSPTSIGLEPRPSYVRRTRRYQEDRTVARIAFSDQLLHGWDLAKATGQDTTMPEGLPDAAYEMIHGRFTDDQRKGVFKPEIEVGADASAEDRLLAYTGRDPSS